MSLSGSLRSQRSKLLLLFGVEVEDDGGGDVVGMVEVGSGI